MAIATPALVLNAPQASSMSDMEMLAKGGIAL
jgi:hypothetical protein